MKRPATVETEAAAWLVKRDRGLSAAEQDAFLQWLAADPRHGDALAREQRTWRELDALAGWRPEHGAEPNPDLLARPLRPAAPRLSWLLPLAAAAAFALLFAGRRTDYAPPAPTAATTTAAAYEKRILEDGSVAELNRGAAILVAYSAGERRVELLQGEGHFTVAKRPDRPFVVRAHGVETRALGTAFHVRLGATAVEVLVTEGRVQIAGPALAANPDGPVVSAGQRVVVPLAKGSSAPVVERVSEDAVARALAWQPQLLEFSSAPLAQVVAEFNRHNTVRLVIEDPALAEIPIVASFRSDNVEGFVRLLEVTAGMRAERRDGTVVLQRRE